MSSDDKPFACTYAKCGLKFTTVDKLTVHMQKHELNIAGFPHLFPDQTPTPTTFLKDYESLALFQDFVPKNPFDESFRKAVINPDSETSEVDTLDTPSLPLGLDSPATALGLNTPTLFREMPTGSLLTPNLDPRLPGNELGDSLDTPAIIDLSLSMTNSPIIASHPLTRRQSSFTRRFASPLAPKKKIVLKPPSTVIKNSNSNKTQMVSLLKPPMDSAMVSPPKPATTDMHRSISPAKILDVFISDQPTRIDPAIDVVSNPSSNHQIAFVMPAIPAKCLQYPLPNECIVDCTKLSGQQATESLPIKNGNEVNLSFVKQKLKMALTKDAQPSSVGSTDSTQEEAQMFHEKRPYDNSDNSGSDVREDEKRQRTLERNRDAARRCRKKKKVFIQTLEQRLKEALNSNSQILSENNKLKVEVTELKLLFLAHKDCEVTKQQLADGLLDSLFQNANEKKVKEERFIKEQT